MRMEDSSHRDLTGADNTCSNSVKPSSPACSKASEGNSTETSSPNKRRRQSTDCRNIDEVRQPVSYMEKPASEKSQMPVQQTSSSVTDTRASPATTALNSLEEPAKVPTKNAGLPSLVFSECAAAAAEATKSTVDECQIQGGMAYAEEDEEDDEPDVPLQVRWGNKVIVLQLKSLDLETFTVGDVKERIEAITTVPADKQTLLGVSPPPGQKLNNAMLLMSLKFVRRNSICLVGSSREALDDAEMRLRQAQLETVDGDSFAGSCDSTGSMESFMQQIQKQHQDRLSRTLKRVDLQFLNRPRPGKKLLVLDLDHTLFDCKGDTPISERRRPFLDQFMEAAYEDYDLAVWSQTHWRWVEVKCTELGFLTNHKFKISFVLDRSSMVTVTSPYPKANGKSSGSTLVFKAPDGTQMRSHEVKALEFIWQKCSCYNATNTLHVDDLARNFFLNPRNGIKIKPYRAYNRNTDRELCLLTLFLKIAAAEEDVTRSDPTRWRSVVLERLRSQSYRST